MRKALMCLFLLSCALPAFAAGDPVADAIDILNNSKASSAAGVEKAGVAGVPHADYERIVQQAIAVADGNSGTLRRIEERQHGVVLGEVKQPFDILGIRIGDNIETVNQVIIDAFPEAKARNLFMTRDINAKKVRLNFPDPTNGWYGSDAFENTPPYILLRQSIDIGYRVGKMEAFYDSDNRLIYMSYRRSMESLRSRQNYVDLASDVIGKYGFPSFIYSRGHEVMGTGLTKGYPFARSDDCSEIRDVIKEIQDTDYKAMRQSLPTKVVDRKIEADRAKVKSLTTQAHQCLVERSYERRPTDFQKLSDMLLDAERRNPEKTEYYWFCDSNDAHLAVVDDEPILSPERMFERGAENDHRYCGLTAEIGEASLMLVVSDYVISDIDKKSAEQQAPTPKVKF